MGQEGTAVPPQRSEESNTTPKEEEDWYELVCWGPGWGSFLELGSLSCWVEVGFLSPPFLGTRGGKRQHVAKEGALPKGEGKTGSISQTDRGGNETPAFPLPNLLFSCFLLPRLPLPSAEDCT